MEVEAPTYALLRRGKGFLPLRNPLLGQSLLELVNWKVIRPLHKTESVVLLLFVCFFFTLNAMSLSILYIFIIRYTSALDSCFIFKGISGNRIFSPLVKVCDQSNPLLGTFRLISALIGWAESLIFRVRMAFSPSAIIEHVIVRQSSVTVHCMFSSGSVTGRGHILWSRCGRSWSPWWSPLRWWPPLARQSRQVVMLMMITIRTAGITQTWTLFNKAKCKHVNTCTWTLPNSITVTTLNLRLFYWISFWHTLLSYPMPFSFIDITTLLLCLAYFLIVLGLHAAKVIRVLTVSVMRCERSTQTLYWF